jgi:imidazole glycerol-phosphate synthase subunit HisH
VKVAVVDHGMGNLRSVAKALERAGADTLVTDDASELMRADALCVPGQGIFGRCMHNLESSALRDAITSWIDDGHRFLGICLGMQILFETSDEAGSTSGLGILSGRVTRITGHVRVPHIGWNTVAPAEDDPTTEARYFYFDHSYVVRPADESLVTAWCDHGGRFAAWIETDSITAVQFHPEKSGSEGLRFLERWVSE